MHSVFSTAPPGTPGTPGISQPVARATNQKTPNLHLFRFAGDVKETRNKHTETHTHTLVKIHRYVKPVMAWDGRAETKTNRPIVLPNCKCALRTGRPLPKRHRAAWSLRVWVWGEWTREGFDSALPSPPPCHSFTFALLSSWSACCMRARVLVSVASGASRRCSSPHDRLYTPKGVR